MVKRLPRIVLLVLAVALLVLAYRHWFPNEEQRIRRMLSDVAREACIPANPKPLGNLAAAQKLASFFSPEVEIHVDAPSYGQHTLMGRDEIMQAVLAARANLKNLKVEFLDPNVALDASQESATVELTAKVTHTGERDFGVQELKFQMKRLDGQWRINRVETVRTLGQ